MTEHTLTPWHSDDTAIFAQDGVLARIPNHPDNGVNWRADAAFIVKAVNNHDALVQALRALVDQINDYERVNNLAPNPGRTECWDTVARAKEVLGLVGSPKQ